MKGSVGSILLVFGISITISANAQDNQPWRKYIISKKISDSSLNTKKLLHSKTKKALENNIAIFYLYKNGALVKPPKDSASDFFAAGCLCFKFNDTLLLNSGLGKYAGVGVGIKIYQDKFTTTLHANPGMTLTYKDKKSDSIYKRDITVLPEMQSLKLSKEPSFSSDEVIVGDLTATYKRFYQTVHHKDQSRVYSVRLIFKCKVTAMDSMKDATGMRQ